MKIFIAEDETDISKNLEYNFKKEGFQTESCGDGKQSLKKILASPPDLLILDIMLPGMDGISICRSLRQNDKTKNLPIIMLTARSSEIDKIIGLENGADDYVTKPFSPAELTARVKALIRRCDKKNEPQKNKITYKDLELDLEKIKLSFKNKEIKLTAKEFLILKELILNKEKVISRDSLLEKIWGCTTASAFDTRTVDVHIMNLRKKLGKYGDKIHTLKNFGYSWRESD
ncbi:MAG: response regulator transcription factor [Elusimicrobiota bacterium]